MDVIKPPLSYDVGNRKVVFLAGTIDNGDSENWQEKVCSALFSLDILVLNPRRDSWDASWVQSIDNMQFKEQVEWELKGLDDASTVFLYLAPGSQSPISLLEFGLYVRERKLIVVCPDGFWKKGNVDVVCRKYGVPVLDNLDAGIAELQRQCA